MADAKPRPVGIATQRAVCNPACTLPTELRHLLLVLAVLANRSTGLGTSGQERIGAAMGVTARTVRRLLAELELRADSPVIVARRPRMRTGKGRGRTSDVYQLLLGTDQPDADVRLNAAEQPDAHDRKVEPPKSTTNRTPLHDQPDTGGRTNRTPASGPDPGSDPRSRSGESFVAPSGAPQNDPWQLSVDGDLDAPIAKPETSKRAAKTRKAKRAAPIPEDFQPSDKHKAFAAKHGLDIELERIGFLGHFEGQSVKSPNGRFTTWLTNAVKFARERAGKGSKGNGRIPPQEATLEAAERAIRIATGGAA